MPLVVQAVDAALNVAEREVSQLSAERTKLMNELDTSSEPEDGLDPAADEELVAGLSPELSYRAAVTRPPDQCATNPENALSNPQCRRVARHAEEDLPLPKIFVYDVPTKFTTDMSHKWKRCSTDQYGTEVFFHEALVAARDVRTTRPEEADFFFVPIYGGATKP